MNLQEALVKEIKRNQELLEQYKAIPTGGFGVMNITLDLEQAYHALACDDVVEMTRAYEALKDNE